MKVRTTVIQVRRPARFSWEVATHERESRMIVEYRDEDGEKRRLEVEVDGYQFVEFARDFLLSAGFTSFPTPTPHD